MGYNASGADDAIISDRNAWAYCDGGTEPTIVSDMNRFGIT